MTLSIIIPVFNTEAYIAACLDSILSQSFSDYEVLLVDDGSTDRSGIICDEYATKDNRIRVFHKENGGVSSARNLGLDNVNGDWIGFVDADDELLPNGLKTMIDYISDDIDIVMAGYERYDKDGHVSYKVEDRVITKLNKKESLSIMYKRHELYYVYLGFVWNRLFRAQIIRDYHLRFDPELAIKEDTLFVTQYILHSNGSTLFSTTPVYRYNERESSAMDGLKRGGNYGLIDGFNALIKMKHEITNSFPSYSEIVFIAEEGIWIRYHQILKIIKKSGVNDEKFQSVLDEAVSRELSLCFFIRKRIRRLLRKGLGTCSQKWI